MEFIEWLSATTQSSDLSFMLISNEKPEEKENIKLMIKTLIFIDCFSGFYSDLVSLANSFIDNKVEMN